MRKLYFLDKSFGPGGSFAGMALVIIGIILTPFYWTGAILFILGAFTGFSGTACEVDLTKRRVRPCQMHFGLIKSGKWIPVDAFVGIRVVRTTRSYRTFSLSSRTMHTNQEDYRVVLEAGTLQSRVEVMKFISKEEATTEAGELAKALGLDILIN